MAKKKKEKICNGCGNELNQCECGFDVITNPPEFIKRRSDVIFEKKINELEIINKIIILINFVFDNLPLVYVTRSGCEVEEFPFEIHSGHDSSRIIGSLLITELNELLVNLCVGSYYSAIRNNRSLIEWLVRTIAAVSDRSLLTSEKENNQNKAVCFEGLEVLLERAELLAKAPKHLRKEFKKSFELYKKNPNHDKKIAEILGAEIPPGIGNIPNGLNPKILQHLKIQNPENNQTIQNSEVIYCIYTILSKYVHNHMRRIDELEPGGNTQFLNLKQFDEVFPIIITSLDVIIYLYFMLIDIDIFHCNLDWKKQWRVNVKEFFDQAKFDQKYFLATNSLLNSQDWNSNPPIQFVLEH